MKELDKKYNPREFEDAIYSFWCENGLFAPPEKPQNEHFTIVIPPPNVTGQLHMGHALDETLQDILIRFKRMQGYDTLWVPGTDHAGIATQIKVEAVLRETEHLSRYDLGREKFLERVWDWKNKYGSRIINQLKKLGSSCDWGRERFTMDEGCSKAVKETFVSLYDKGLIYRGHRIINWCPQCETALSDAEVEYEEKDGHFWHIRYPFKEGGGFVEIATTRPETLLGDTAVAVNPEDERYTALVGKTLILPLVGREIPVIADDYVDKDFGTGCVKITPAHDPNDFMVGERHGLEQINIMNGDATINANGGKYEGLDRYAARKAVLEDLEAGGYLVKTEGCKHNVGTCYRCGTTVEPLISDQWFVKMAPLAEKAIEVVENGTIKFVPDRFSKIYLNWMRNIRDWCISRQLWWGHRIPAFYCDTCGEMVVTKEDSPVCPKCGRPMRQDPDVLDTWFSSGLWPFSTLGWPEQTEDLKRFYPTSVLVTGYDIIPFWVARMISMGMECMGEKPFSTVLIHGLVRDALGRKMSKSLGNGIDPLEIIDKYGADALRFALATGNSPGNDMRFSDEKVESSRNFANKIWNAARFVHMNLEKEWSSSELDVAPLETEDRWLVSLYNKLVAEVTENLEKFELGIAVQKLYDFIWDIFCDWYIELVKPRLMQKGSATGETAQKVLTYVLSGVCRLLHPFMPFITEQIWQSLPHEGISVSAAAWPATDPRFDFAADEEKMNEIIASIRSVRNCRAERNVPPSRKTRLFIKTDRADIFGGAETYFKFLASASDLEFVTDENALPASVRAITHAATVFIPLGDLVDAEAERARIKKELEKCEKEIEILTRKLSNAEFCAKAPEKVVEAEREKLKKQLALKESLLDAKEI
ncbi:MAG: valine--tRNA ligase [Clostridia bacterium]|nr:valine--tRNA ligase [Clostridia bacterium]